MRDRHGSLFGGHHWAREFSRHGHAVKLIAPKFVTPYRLSGKRGKNDAADAAAICEAVSRPNMRFVPVKTQEQQSQLMVHRARQGFVQARTATINRIRGLLSECGIVLPLKASTVRRQAALHLEDLPGYANTVIGDLLSEVTRLDERIAQYDVHIRNMTTTQDLLQAVLAGDNLAQAWKRVKANKGAPGIDGVTIEDFPAHARARAHWPALREQIEGGRYQPQAVRRVEIRCHSLQAEDGPYVKTLLG